MAKATGPLFSMDASGKFGGALVFGKWKGRNTIRQLVTPANPNSTTQEAARNAVRILGGGQKWTNGTAEIRTGETLTDKVLLTAAAPAGQAWNGFMVKSGIGAGSVNFDAAAAAYAALTAPQKAAWDAGAAALTPAILPVNQTVAGGGAGTPATAGAVFFHACYAMYIAGIYAAAPGAVPPDYA